MLIVEYASSFAELVDLLAERRYRLGVRQTIIDEVVGLAVGHTSKIESKIKRLGDVSRRALLDAHGKRLAVVEAPEGPPRQTRAVMHTAKHHGIRGAVAPAIDTQAP
jgi:hypothetical protein